jgi:hypothetical protein
MNNGYGGLRVVKIEGFIVARGECEDAIRISYSSAGKPEKLLIMPKK